MPASSDFSPADESIVAYHGAARRLLDRIRLDEPVDQSRAAINQRAVAKLARLERFLAFAGSPQHRVRVIHVTGTSGKGSTAAGIAALLNDAGIRTGLYTSPYLQVATEKLEIAGKLISGSALRQELEAIESLERSWLAAGSENRMLSHAEVWVAMMLRWFDREAVEIAVVEVGAGGRFDATNVVKPIASVITNVGLDHVKTLGPGIEDIAWHKAGIIKPGAPVITGPLQPSVLPIIKRVAQTVGVRLSSTTEHGTLGPGDVGNEQAEFRRANDALALLTVRTIASEGFVPLAAISPHALTRNLLPGRFETMPDHGGCRVVLDGAHNPDKIAALAQEIRRQTVDHGWPLPVVVLGLLASKDIASVVAALAPVSGALVATTARVLGKPAAAPATIAAAFTVLGRGEAITIEPDPERALAIARVQADQAGSWVLVTGSLYLVGELRQHWFGNDEIVAAQSPWGWTAVTS